MAQNSLQSLAQQLKQPSGIAGKQLGDKMNITNAGINKLTINQLQLQAGEHILEIGMGNGYFVKDIFLAAPAVTYVGCDFSEIMVAEANAINKDYIVKGQAQFLWAAAHQLPFAAATFDQVFTVNTLYFWDNPSRELTEIRRVLKPAGKLSLAIRPRAVMETYPFTQYGFILYNAAQLTRLLEQNDFKVTQVQEIAEPDQEINGTLVKVTSLLVQAIAVTA